MESFRCARHPSARGRILAHPGARAARRSRHYWLSHFADEEFGEWEAQQCPGHPRLTLLDTAEGDATREAWPHQCAHCNSAAFHDDHG